MGEIRVESAPLDHQLPARDLAIQQAEQIWQRWSTEHLDGEKQAAAVGEWFRAQQGWRTLVGALRTQNSQALAAWCLGVARTTPKELGPQPIRLLNRLTEQVRVAVSQASIKAAATKLDRRSPRAVEHALPAQRAHTPCQSYLVKSLSNLASQSRRHGALQFARHCSELAVQYVPHDPVACNGRAEVLKAQGQLAKALRAYDQILVEFPQNIIARNGRAAVLKAQGRLGDALVAYDQIIAEFPADVTSRNGRAEAIKALGNYSEALAAYEQIIAEFPDNVVARNGRAAVLKAQGRLPEALAAYSQTLMEFPDNVIARNGRADLLRALRKGSVNPSRLTGSAPGPSPLRPGPCGPKR